MINAAAGLFGARVVSANWGPRGVAETLRRAKSRGFHPRLVLDVGASNGQWTRECLSIFADPRYVLIDPLEANRAALSALAAEEAGVSIFHGVAASQPGSVKIFDHGDQSSLLSSVDFPGAARDVEATTVDLLLQDRGVVSPLLFKADVQGYELEVLKGASRTLESTEMLILEVSFRKIYQDSALAHEIVAYVGERGFRVFDMCTYLQRASDRDLIQSDFVFVHESSALMSRQGWS